MADWNVTWVPKTIEFTPIFNTVVSPYESGTIQYASKWTNPGYRFMLHFESRELTPALVYAIRAFFIARKGRYEIFTFPNYAEVIKGTTLALVENGANPDTITDSGNGILVAGFRTSGKVTIAGSTTGGNNTVLDVHASTAPVAGTLTLVADDDITADSANAALTIYNTYNVHFASDELWQRNTQDSSGAIQTIELYAEPY